LFIQARQIHCPSYA